MADILSKLQAPPGAVTKARRIGRGVGSGLGKTSGRGQKGQKARSKGNINKVHFQGGQTPMQRRLPKRGFRNPFGPEVAIVAVGDLESLAVGIPVDVAALRDAGMVRGAFDQLKILGDGELTKALTVSAHKFSKSAKEKIEKAGGTCVEIPIRAASQRGPLVDPADAAVPTKKSSGAAAKAPTGEAAPTAKSAGKPAAQPTGKPAAQSTGKKAPASDSSKKG